MARKLVSTSDQLDAYRRLDPLQKQELRRAMQRKWDAPGVINAKRFNKFVLPMSMGSSYGYQDDIAAD